MVLQKKESSLKKSLNVYSLTLRNNTIQLSAHTGLAAGSTCGKACPSIVFSMSLQKLLD